MAGRVPFHFDNDLKHFRDGNLMFRKESLSEIVKDILIVLTLVALGTLSGHSLLDCARTLAVRIRHPV